MLEEPGYWPAPMENLRNRDRKPHKEFFLFIQGFSIFFAVHCAARSHPSSITSANPIAARVASLGGSERECEEEEAVLDSALPAALGSDVQGEEGRMGSALVVAERPPLVEGR